MSKGVVIGNDVKLSLSDDGGATWKYWGCCQTMAYEETTEFLSRTPVSTYWRSVIPTYHSGSIEMTGLYLLSDSDNNTHLSKVLFDWRRNKQLIMFRAVFGSGGDIYEGNAYIEKTRAIGNVDEFATFNVTMIVTETSYIYQQVSLECPIVVETADTLSSLTFEFNASNNATSYVFELFQGITLIDTQTVTAPYSNPEQVVFTGLDPNEVYGLEVTVFNSVDLASKACARQNSTTEDILCPSVTRSANDDTITYSFTDTAQGVQQWKMELREGSTLLDTDTFTAPFSNPVSGSFTGLNTGTAYTITLVGTFGTYNKACGPYSISTTGGPTGYPYVVGLGVTTGQACFRAQEQSENQTVYSPSSTWTPGMTLYSDPSMTPASIVTGFDFVVEVGVFEIFNLDDTTGVLGVTTGNFC